MENKPSCDERKVWLDYLKELKTVQFNKLNNTTLKMGTLITFMTAAIVFIINTLPVSKPSSIKLYLALIAFNTLFGVTITCSNLFNLLFRQKKVDSNVLGTYGKLKKQYSKPVLLMSIFQIIIWIVLLLCMFVLMIYHRFVYWYLSIPSIFFLADACHLLECTLIPFFKNYFNIAHEYKSRIRNIIYIISSFFCLLNMIYIPIAFYFSGFVFENKKALIFAIYFLGLFLSLAYIPKFLTNRIIYSWFEKIYNDAHLLSYTADEIKVILNSVMSDIGDLDTISFDEVGAGGQPNGRTETKAEAAGKLK